MSKIFKAVFLKINSKRLVCPLGCLPVNNISGEIYWSNLHENFITYLRTWTRISPLNFGSNPVPDSGSGRDSSWWTSVLSEFSCWFFLFLIRVRLLLGFHPPRYWRSRLIEMGGRREGATYRVKTNSYSTDCHSFFGTTIYM